MAMELVHYQKMVIAMMAKLEIPALHQLFPKVLTVLVGVFGLGVCGSINCCTKAGVEIGADC